MSAKNVKLDLGQFASLINRSREDVRLLAEQKASEGLWRFKPGLGSEAIVELPSSDLYHELEAAAGVNHSQDHRSLDNFSSARQTPEGSIRHLEHENEHLRAILKDSAELLEELKNNGNNRECMSDNFSSSNIDFAVTKWPAEKSELVRAYDRIIDLQRQLADTQQENLRLLEENQMAIELRGLFARYGMISHDPRERRLK
jgi:hypothetical protein